jgi:GNAT acetyltransferase-like protein
MTSYRAELIADGGAAAASEEFFRSPRFLAAEGVTHTLRISGESGEEPLCIPLVVSEIPGTDLRDAASPYGFPSGTGSATPAPRPAAIDFSAAGLVSVFIRDRVGEETCLRGGTLRGRVQIADPALPRKSRMSDRQQVRRNLRGGWVVETVPGAGATAEQRAGYERAYGETMRRTRAAPRYDFSSEYFAAVLGGEGAWLLLALAPDGAVGAGSIAVRSDGFLHYYLSGTADAHLADSPMKNVIEAMIELAGELGLPLNLGGGAVPGDSLEAFKRGFANREEPFHTHEVICDPAAYERLGGSPDATFFPLYRSPPN